MKLRVILPSSAMDSLNRAILTVNDRPWGGFGARTLKLVRAIPDRVLDHGMMEVITDFDVDVSGTADRMPVPEGVSRKLADRLQSNSLYETTDFAAIFGDDRSSNPLSPTLEAELRGR